MMLHASMMTAPSQERRQHQAAIAEATFGGFERGDIVIQ
jgi:hypothetical protein